MGEPGDDRLAADLRAEFPDQRGWSRSNLHYMRALAAAWPDSGVVPQPVGQLPWGHLRVLLDKLESRPAGLVRRPDPRARLVRGRPGAPDRQPAERAGRCGAVELPRPAAGRGSELAQQMLRDPYVFDHLQLTERVSARQLEQAFMDRLQDTLLALGHGMAIVGRQVRFDVDGDELKIDLLLFHVGQLRYVVIEIKIGRFELGYVGQLGTYVALVDDRLRRSDRHAPTVGILLCTSRNEQVVRYALSASTAPMAVAGYTYDTLPAAERAALPTATELAAALELPGEDKPPQPT